MIAKFIVAISAFYHILATVAAMMAVFQCARILRGEESHHPLWRHIFERAEAHLWISGLMLLAGGIYLSGLEDYLANPKLWTKVCLVTLWAANSLCIKKMLRRAPSGLRNLMFGTSIASLFYGTFLGVAKPLAYGVLPFPYFLAGFVLSIVVGTYGVSRLLKPMRLATRLTNKFFGAFSPANEKGSRSTPLVFVLISSRRQRLADELSG